MRQHTAFMADDIFVPSVEALPMYVCTGREGTSGCRYRLIFKKSPSEIKVS